MGETPKCEHEWNTEELSGGRALLQCVVCNKRLMLKPGETISNKLKDKK